MDIAKSGQIAEFFDQRGYACVEKSSLTEEKATELAIEINAEEVIESIDDDGVREVWKVSPGFHGRSIQHAFLFLHHAVSRSTHVRWADESESNSTGLRSDIRRLGVYSKSDCPAE